MHELSIAQNIIDIVRAEMRRYDAKRLKAVRLEIGSLSSVAPDSLSFCFDAVISDTEFEGARLIIDIIPLSGSCGGCDREFEIKDYSFKCPFCMGRDITTVSGRELSIVEMEVD
jgi:hydrogenase nickel incorporation protein HypA/HybF